MVMSLEHISFEIYEITGIFVFRHDMAVLQRVLTKFLEILLAFRCQETQVIFQEKVIFYEICRKK